jgi:hypothetical protein
VIRRYRPELALLGGAERRATRPRGFVDWNPQKNTQALLSQVQAVLDEYADYLPLAIRQIFYRLVGAHGYDKTEHAYERLVEHLNRARRAQRIPMDAIRDDGGQVSRPFSFHDAEEFMDQVIVWASEFTLDRTEGQNIRLAVMCEAAGMVPQLERVAHPYGIAVISSGGFDSLTDKYKFAAELADHDRPTEVLHIGDHDPSGVHLYLALLEDVKAFAQRLGGEVMFDRLAVTPPQIERYALPTAPAKATDDRAFGGDTCQAEALAPDQLATILRDAIESRLDRAAYDAALRRERQIRRRLRTRLGD